MITSENPKVIVYFDSSWSRKILPKDNIDVVNLVKYSGLDCLYHIADEFCDEMESYVIRNGAKSLPCLAVYDNGNLASISSTLDLSETIPTLNTHLNGSLIGFDSQIQTLSETVNKMSANNPVRLFISGDRSSVGKSTCCLYLIAALVNAGVNPCDIAYIKPVTQCESEQPVSKYCVLNGIKSRGIGPVVFYKGFTRAFLDGNTDSSDQLLDSVVESVKDIEEGKKLVIIDGVGYPAVGSICGVSNADVAKALKAPVLLVGKSGVGDAVDSFNLNCRYFEGVGVKVLGAIFNKIALEGYYNVESCRAAVTLYFDKYGNSHKAYGFIPSIDIPTETSNEGDLSSDFLATFMQSVSIRDILTDAIYAQYASDCDKLSSIFLRCKIDKISGMPMTKINLQQMDIDEDEIPRQFSFRSGSNITNFKDTEPKDVSKGKKRTRADIEADARKKGAKGG